MISGKFIVIYGINNIGKTTQTAMLVKRLITEGYRVEQVKYPVYDLQPTGPIIDAICRKGAGTHMSEWDIQNIYTKNRRDYEPTIIQMLRLGIHVIAEDYTGTGIAWGMTRGVPLIDLEHMNANLLKEDMAILLDGERFSAGKEDGHRNEDHDDLIRTSRDIHIQLRDRYGWSTVRANQSREKVHSDIWEIIRQII